MSGNCIADGTCDGDNDCDTGKCSSANVCIAIGDCSTKLDCEVGVQVCNDEGKCVAGMGCGATEFNAGSASDLMIVLDNSCSMNQDAEEGANAISKWQAAVDAVNAVLGTHGDRIDFGLELFPDKVDAACVMEEIPLGFVLGSDPASMIDFLTASRDDPDHAYAPRKGPCKTPIGAALGGKNYVDETCTDDANKLGCSYALSGEPVQGVLFDPAILNPDSNRSVNMLLVTDGNPVCGGTVSKIETLLRYHYREQDVRTFVVGFGKGVDPQNLAKFAAAGDDPGIVVPAGQTQYYLADSAAELDAALGAVAGSIGCTIVADLTDQSGNPVDPPAKEDLYVFFSDSHLVPEDQYTWDPNTGEIVFADGSDACNRLQITDDTNPMWVSDIDVVVGCPGPVVD
jgi:hypothetical protein